MNKNEATNHAIRGLDRGEKIIAIGEGRIFDTQRRPLNDKERRIVRTIWLVWVSGFIVSIVPIAVGLDDVIQLTVLSVVCLLAAIVTWIGRKKLYSGRSDYSNSEPRYFVLTSDRIFQITDEIKTLALKKEIVKIRKHGKKLVVCTGSKEFELILNTSRS